jgi:hypothetical protein
MRKFPIIATLLLSSVVAKASDPREQFYWVSGQQLTKACAPDQMDRCDAFIRGVIDTTNTLAVTSVGQRKICIPDTFSMNVLEQVVVDYLRQHPDEITRYPGAGIVYAAMTNSFSCPNVVGRR